MGANGKNNGNGNGKNNGTQETGQVINFRQVREAKMDEKRRKYERILFTNILGAYFVIEGSGRLSAVELIDVSSDGLSFQLPTDSKNTGALKSGEEMSFRLYFTKDTFISVDVKIVHERQCIENGGSYVRFGCSVIQGSSNYQAYKAFVEFMAQFAEAARSDDGGLKLSYF
jgi:hypothetical protein